MKHNVESGEGIARIAFRYGFFSGTLWDLPENADLRKLRGDPEMLLAGDEVFVPDLRPKAVVIATGATHRFRRRGVPATINIRLLHDTDQPRANEAYVLDVDGVQIPGTTDAEGRVFSFVSPNAKVVKLLLKNGEEVYDIDIDRLDPIDTLIGMQRRLINLGHLQQDPTGVLDQATRDALVRFQHAIGISETGEVDAETRDALLTAHGS